MKAKKNLTLQTIIALIFCPLLFTSLQKFDFNKQNSLNVPPYHLTPQLFKFITLGYWPAASDALWIGTLQKIGAKTFTPELKQSTAEFYDLATDLDPYFFELYNQAGPTLSSLFHDGASATLILQKGIRVYENGLTQPKFWPTPFSLYLYQAYIYAFLENDWAHAKATFLAASEIKGAPYYLTEMKVWLKEEHSENELARRVLHMMINNTKDEDLKESYQEMLKKYE